MACTMRNKTIRTHGRSTSSMRALRGPFVVMSHGFPKLNIGGGSSAEGILTDHRGSAACIGRKALGCTQFHRSFDWRRAPIRTLQYSVILKDTSRGIVASLRPHGA